MGGERASKVRQREAGLTCYRCDRWIYTRLPPAPGAQPEPASIPRYARNETLCAFCECNGALHALYFLRGAERTVPGGIGPGGEPLPSQIVSGGEWTMQFLTPDCTRNFGRYYEIWGSERGADAIRRLVASGTVLNPAPNSNGVPWDLETELRHGRGGVTLQFDWPRFRRLTTRGQSFSQG